MLNSWGAPKTGCMGYGDEGVKRAAIAGVDSIERGNMAFTGKVDFVMKEGIVYKG